MIVQWFEIDEGKALEAICGTEKIRVARKSKGAQTWTVKIGRKWIGDLHSKEAAKAAGLEATRNLKGIT